MFLILVLMTAFAVHSAIDLPNFQFNEAEKEAQYWRDFTKIRLFDAYHHKPINKRAKNVIIFLGDGMGISTITPSRILKGQLDNKSGEESKLVFEDFPYVSLIKTYNVDYQVPDSAGTATAFLCGVKTNKAVIGVSAKVKLGELDCDVVQKNKLDSILKWALDSGKSAGIVTTARITHATPAGGYASVSDRDWEGSQPEKVGKSGKCKDIGRQLVENEPGMRLNVIMGGGSRYLLPPTVNDTISGKPGQRNDSRNLIKNWLDMKKKNGLSPDRYTFVDTRPKLLSVSDKVDYLFGIFHDDHVSYDMERNPELEPSLSEMTEAAINVLKKNDNGFVLLVEGGRIDHSHHDNYGVQALYETVAFDRAVDTALSATRSEETLIVVTADHSHTFTMNGYPKRGNNIKGLSDKDEQTKLPFTTLMYGNGPGHQKDRTDPSTVDTSALRYQSYAAVYLESSNHGGEDVGLWSTGPMAHLFRGTQEQSYVAHAMAFAACIGDYRHFDHCPTSSASKCYFPHLNSVLFSLLLFICKYIRF